MNAAETAKIATFARNWIEKMGNSNAKEALSQSLDNFNKGDLFLAGSMHHLAQTLETKLPESDREAFYCASKWITTLAKG